MQEAVSRKKKIPNEDLRPGVCHCLDNLEGGYG